MVPKGPPKDPDSFFLPKGPKKKGGRKAEHKSGSFGGPGLWVVEPGTSWNPWLTPLLVEIVR